MSCLKVIWSQCLPVFTHNLRSGIFPDILFSLNCNQYYPLIIYRKPGKSNEQNLRNMPRRTFRSSFGTTFGYVSVHKQLRNQNFHRHAIFTESCQKLCCMILKRFQKKITKKNSIKFKKMALFTALLAISSNAICLFCLFVTPNGFQFGPSAPEIWLL